MKSQLIIFLVILSHNLCYSQYKLKDIGYDLSTINKTDNMGKQGIWFFYYKKDSTIYAMQHFINDTLNGYFERYWYNGIISEKGYYKNGNFDSTYLAYWENGSLRGDVFYSNGLLNGIATCYGKEGRITTRQKYQMGIIDSTYNDSFIDPTIVWDNHPKAKIDTIVTMYSINWNKKLSIYRNDSLIKDISFYKDIIQIENIYERTVNVKRIVYSDKKPYLVKKIFYYDDAHLTRTEVYNKEGQLIKEIIVKIPLKLIDKPCESISEGTCTCTRKLFSPDQNIYLEKRESRTNKKFTSERTCFSITLHMYSSSISLDSIYFSNIENKDILYLAEFIEGDYSIRSRKVSINISFLNPFINSSRSTEHTYKIRYNIDLKKVESVKLDFSDDIQ